ncbi:MAG: hypothetical protein ACK4Z6_03425 [Candidatus Methylomirabilales bacterium]
MPKDEAKRCPYGVCPFCAILDAQETLFKGVKAILPDAFRQHVLAAERETLLALRSLIDALLQAMEKKPKEKAKRIPVE